MRRPKPPYIETLWLRRGQQIFERGTGRGGYVDRVVSNLRYMVNFSGKVEHKRGAELELPRQ